MSNTIIINQHTGWVEIILNRPESLNSFTEEMHLALRDALTQARDTPNCRAILITGAGRGFCAGQDLGDRDPSKMDGPPDLSQTLNNFYNPLVRLIRDMPKPIICAVNGVAAGAGVNLALNCDIVFADETAKFIQSFAKVGLIPDAGGTWHLPRLLGEARAKALSLTAQPISGKQAAEWGLIWKALPQDALMEEAKALAEHFSNGPTVGLGLIKKTIHQSASNSLDQQLDLEAKTQGETGRTNDYAEGVSAFLEKRSPNFKGQ